MRKKICFVVQRYGIEVNGGAELLCRQFAEKMAAKHEVTVYTTKAIDYVTWKNEYPVEEEMLNGVKVCRFGVDMTRDPEEFDRINGLFYAGKLEQHQEDQWFIAQGPFVPRLIEALKISKDRFDAFIFNTYLYYPSIYGIPEVAEKAIFIPDAHDEPFLNFHRVQEIFTKPAAIFYNTEEEHELISKRFHNDNIPYAIGGVGVEIPAHPAPEVFCEKYGIKDPYVIYVGRIDEGKNCNQMFLYWDLYKKRHPSSLKLLLIGKAVIPVPEREDIISLGFVSDEDKFAGIEGAKFLWLPSRFESLSIVVLEAMSLKVPVLVNGACAVLKGHCIKSNAGLYYENYQEFEGAMNFLRKDSTLLDAMCSVAPCYVKNNYQWETILNRLETLIELVAQPKE